MADGVSTPHTVTANPRAIPARTPMPMTGPVMVIRNRKRKAIKVDTRMSSGPGSNRPGEVARLGPPVARMSSTFPTLPGAGLFRREIGGGDAAVHHQRGAGHQRGVVR